MNYLLKNVRMSSTDEIRDIYIEDGVISKIEANIDEHGVEVIDLENRLVLDGFVDAHM
ncbi:MAG: dihydropyrimidinase, partial [Tissierellia bacterium]|nr:dihydropyrimidinase [Tissierellia bacterium]